MVGTRAKAWNFTPRCPSARQIRSSPHFSICHPSTLRSFFISLLFGVCLIIIIFVSSMETKSQSYMWCEHRMAPNLFCERHIKLPPKRGCHVSETHLNCHCCFGFSHFPSCFRVNCVCATPNAKHSAQSVHFVFKVNNENCERRKSSFTLPLLSLLSPVLFECHLFFDLSCWSHQCSSCLGSRFGKLCEKTKRKSQCVLVLAHSHEHTFTSSHKTPKWKIILATHSPHSLLFISERKIKSVRSSSDSSSSGVMALPYYNSAIRDSRFAHIVLINTTEQMEFWRFNVSDNSRKAAKF